ncbi:uncharacterized protein LOC122049385 [Zingiber officinale]|uniref:Uncharacterized protein n=1 Tax=Zingiber officinale TaxID=94328 RepID=A0A8J5LM80_ZINOF|nr:uncharacterized protein LOC122049385 [Zingiber officinale]KAG6525212.1 hypothetical protein ZIOFF_015166 [Zingiber officinale]
MEGFLHQDYKECISVKKVMLKQEETFRHQVQELHRVYRIQKLLMRDTQPNCKFLRQTDRTSSGKGTPEHYKEPKLDPDEESSDLELTLATGSSTSQWKKRSASYNSHSGSSFSSTSDESAGRKLKNSDWVVPQDFGRFEGKRKSAGLKIEKMRQHELNQPSWLFLCNKRHSMVTSLGL